MIGQRASGIRHRASLLLACCLLPAARCPLLAQDTTSSGVRIGITYAPGTRPSLTVVPYATAGFDSVSAIIARDLDHSDRFELVAATETVRGRMTTQLDAAAFASLGVAVVVSLAGDAGGIAVTAHDPRSGQALARRRVSTGAAMRAEAHAAADDIVRAAFGQNGIASSAVLFVRNGRVWRVDADGHGARELRTAGSPSLSPAWAPDGRSFAYTAYVRSGQPIVVQDAASGARRMLAGTEYGLNITPSFSPDGRRIVYAHAGEGGTDIYVADAGGRGEPQRLTAGRFADNLSPSYSPDGSRIAFISTRAGSPQLYVMNADGTGQEVLARFDFGATGTTSAPAWSPEGQLIAFHREVGGTPQIFVLDASTRALRQLTGSGRNEDPSWAPDGRHLVFVSSRAGGRELWVIDLETGRLRQLTHLSGARLPAWSPRLVEEGR